MELLSTSRRRGTALVAALALLLVVAAPPAGALPQEQVQHCVLAVLSVDPDTHAATTAPLQCSSTESGALAKSRTASATAVGGTTALSYTIATHYTGFNFTGSTLTVTGTGCNGMYINVPAAWVDVISSTRSNCTVTHYDYFYLQGPNLTTFAPGANLTAFDNLTNSAEYL